MEGDSTMACRLNKASYQAYPQPLYGNGLQLHSLSRPLLTVENPHSNSYAALVSCMPFPRSHLMQNLHSVSNMQLFIFLCTT